MTLSHPAPSVKSHDLNHLPLHVHVIVPLALVFGSNHIDVFWLHQDELLPPTDQAMEVVKGVGMEYTLSAAITEPDISIHQLLQVLRAEEGAWHLPLLVHGRRELVHHVDVFSLVTLQGEECVWVM